MKEKILISACFLNNLVRYDGTAYDVKGKVGLDGFNFIAQWQKQGRLFALCPEMSGGLPVPRPAAEIRQGESEQVITQSGIDVSTEFKAGANAALALCQQEGIRMAILTESSPSCGSSTIYNGQFSGEKILGQGVTTALLRKNGIQVFSQFELEKADHFLKKLED